MNNFHIKKLNDQELDRFIELIRLFEEVFEMKDFVIPGSTHLQKLLGKEGFGAFVALEQDRIVGGLTTYTLDQYYSPCPLVYIYDLAVKPEFQRKGIGKVLISTANVFYKEAGMEEIFVQADLVDEYALDFYRATGATEEKVVHFYYPLK